MFTYGFYHAFMFQSKSWFVFFFSVMFVNGHATERYQLILHFLGIFFGSFCFLHWISACKYVWLNTNIERILNQIEWFWPNRS